MMVNLNREIAAAVLVSGFGAATAGYAALHYSMGSVNRMGPGMFPVALGCMLVVIGLGILGKAILARERSSAVEVNIRALIFVVAALAAFGLLIRSTGVIPAVLALVAIATLAVPSLSPRRTLILCLIVTTGVVTIFNGFMGLNFPLFRMPV